MTRRITDTLLYPGTLVTAVLGGHTAYGRVELYEHHTPNQTTFPVKFGSQTKIMTSADVTGPARRPAAGEPAATTVDRSWQGAVTEQDKRLVAALTVFRDQLGPVVDDLLAGKFDTEDRALIAETLRTIADHLDPPATAVNDQTS